MNKYFIDTERRAKTIRKIMRDKKENPVTKKDPTALAEMSSSERRAMYKKAYMKKDNRARTT